MPGRLIDRCVVVCDVCGAGGEEEARESLKLLKALPGDVNAELIESVIP